MYRDNSPGTPDEYEDDGSANASGTPNGFGEVGSDVDEESPEALASEVERLKRVNQQLLSEKSSGEEARREARELRQLILEMNRGRGGRNEDEDSGDEERVRMLRGHIAELERSDDPRDQVTLEIVNELKRTRQKLAMLDGTAGVKISPEDMSAVQQMMDTGEFTTLRAAHKAYLGVKLERLVNDGELVAKSAAAEQRQPKATQAPAKPAVGVNTRPVPRSKTPDKKVMTATEYQQKLRGDDGAEWRRKRLNGDFEVVRG